MVRGEKYWKIEELDLVMCACSSVASGLPAWIAVSTSIARWNMTLISTKVCRAIEVTYVTASRGLI